MAALLPSDAHGPALPRRATLPAHLWMLLWQATNHNSSCSSHTMLHHTPKAYGSLGHDESSHQKKATVTKSNGAHLFKWLAALCVLNSVGAATVPWSAELVATGSNSSVSQRLGRALGEEQHFFEEETYTSPKTGKVYLPFQFCKTMPHSDFGMCLKEDVVHRTPEHHPHRLIPSHPRPHHHITHPQNPLYPHAHTHPTFTPTVSPSPRLHPHTLRTSSLRSRAVPPTRA